MKKLRAPGRKPVTVAAVRPSAAVEAWYYDKLERAIFEMDKSLFYWLKAYFRQHPATTEDASPTKTLHRKMSALARDWQKMFDNMSKKVAADFASKAKRHADTAFKASLKKGGFSVDFQMTGRMQDALDAKIADNIDLIKSIAREHLADVQSHVMRSVQHGRSMKELTEELRGIITLDHPEWDNTKVIRRARLIARDQNNKATSLFHRTRQKELGITTAIWSHTSASKEPREEHEEWNGEPYDIEEGMYSEVDEEFVWPGTPINCGCTSRSVIPGFDTDEEEEE